MTALEIKLDKFDRVYSPTVSLFSFSLLTICSFFPARCPLNITFFFQEVVTGCVIVNTPNGTNHTGIKMTVEGAVTLQLSPRSVGIFEALYNSIKPLILIRNEFDIKKSGKLLKFFCLPSNILSEFFVLSTHFITLYAKVPQIFVFFFSKNQMIEYVWPLGLKAV